MRKLSSSIFLFKRDIEAVTADCTAGAQRGPKTLLKPVWDSLTLSSLGINTPQSTVSSISWNNCPWHFRVTNPDRTAMGGCCCAGLGLQGVQYVLSVGCTGDSQDLHRDFAEIRTINNAKEEGSLDITLKGAVDRGS